MFKRALVSTSDKSGLVEFLKPLAESGCEIVSTGGTSKFLRENKIPVKEVADVTGFPECMDGRVRSLHPKIHMGLLARSHVKGDMDLLRKEGIVPFDLVVVNLYPFEESFKKGLQGEELIEQIDIGGPSLLRASAKSFERVTVVCDPEDYSEVLSKCSSGSNTEEFRRNLAVKVFEHTAFYDSLVAQVLKTESWETSKTLTFGFRKKQDLRYGENPHQKAVWYETPISHTLSLRSAQQLQGKELSYNNILDLESAIGCVADFEEPASVIVKHLTPCGVAQAKNIEEAYRLSFDGDPISAFGGIVALNRPISVELAGSLKAPFLECIVAPGIHPDAQAILSQKKNVRVLILKSLGRPAMNLDEAQDLEFRGIRGGLLIQTADHALRWNPAWKVFGIQPDDKTKSALLFAARVVRHVKSNAIVVASGGQTRGVCGGQTNRVDSVRLALSRALERSQVGNLSQGDWVLASDAFFPFHDSIDIANEFGVKWIIQPGGSLKDQEVIEACQRNGINMIVTGIRQFKH